jgi:Kelch motif
MKKQINPTIKAHLIRSAFYVILLLAVCVIPFALAQRNTTRRSVAGTAGPVTPATAKTATGGLSSTGAANAVNSAKAKARQAPAATRNNIGAPASLAGGVKGAQPHMSVPSQRLKFPYSSIRDVGPSDHKAATAPKRVSPVRKIARRPNGTVCAYDFTTGEAGYVPGVDDIGSHCDDCDTSIALPFAVTLYGNTYTSAFAGSNGHLTFGIDDSGFGITCPTGRAGTTSVLEPYWGDQCTGACNTTSCTGCGIFTTTTGSAPNRVFYIEYRTNYYGLSGQNQDLLTYEVALYENGTPPFEFLYNNIEAAFIANDSELTVGQKQDDVCLTQYGCDTTGGQTPPVSSALVLDAVPLGGATPTPTPGVCGLLVGSGMTTGYLPNGWEPTLASNTVTYTFSNSQAAPNEFALFETHDPWGFTVIKDAITGAGHTYTEFTPADLAGFDFSQYSVVILNWDDTAAPDFISDYSAAIPALEAYINAGGVVWITEAIQSCDGVPMPFGGTGTGCEFGDSDPIADPASPMMTGMPDPIPGTSASHLSFTGLPGGAHVVVLSGADNNPALYDFRPAQCGGSPTPTPTCTPGGAQWSEVAPYPFAARGPFVVSDGTSYYIGGGYDGSDVHADLMLYDPVANTYTPLASAPDPFFLSQAVIFNNKIYSIAGFNLGGQSTTTRIYDIAGNSWTTGAPIPEPNGLSDAATGLDSASGKIYIACGFNGSGASNTLHIYDIATDSWTTGSPAPDALYLPGFGVINGKFYVASGNNGSNEVSDLQIYDIATDTWSTGAPIPTPVTGPGSAVFNGKLYVFGGTAPFPVTTTITQIYDPATDSWSAGPSMVAGKLWFYGGALDDSSILGPGGDDSSIFPTSDVQILAAGGGCASPTPTPSGTPTGCQFNVLIVSSDLGVQPVTLHDQIAAEPDVVAVDYFDAEFNTPTLAQLTPYNIVVSFSNSSYADPVGMGNVLADYADAGGTVVAFNFDWYGPPFGLDGRWITDGYTPFVAGGPINFNNSCLGTYDNTHPLMQGIDPGSLCAFFRHTLALTAGAVSVAEYQDNEHLCAYNVHNGHTGVGINAYVGDGAGPGQWSGPFGHVVVNAGRWVGNCQGGTPTPTPTPTPITPTPTPTPITPTPTPTPATPTPTPTVTITPPPLSPTPTPSATRPPPTPRPRPTPFPRPTP